MFQMQRRTPEWVFVLVVYVLVDVGSPERPWIMQSFSKKNIPFNLPPITLQIAIIVLPRRIVS